MKSVRVGDPILYVDYKGDSTPGWVVGVNFKNDPFPLVQFGEFEPVQLPVESLFEDTDRTNRVDGNDD